MKLEKAIELISTYVNREDFYQVSPETQAMVLGIEALKELRLHRQFMHNSEFELLPGETTESTPKSDLPLGGITIELPGETEK